MLEAAIREAGLKPPEAAKQSDKKNYSEKLSNAIALAIAARLRELGVPGCRPESSSGREREVTPADDVDIVEGVSVDLDADNHIIGREILDASVRMSPDELGNVSIEGVPPS